jgi:hypothetical protein
MNGQFYNLKYYHNSYENAISLITETSSLTKTEITAVGIRGADHATLTSPTSGGCSVGIVRSRTKATELLLLLLYCLELVPAINTVLLLGAPLLPTWWVKISTYFQLEPFL